MAASTISRDSWTNDTGSASTPAGDGTLLTNTVLQNHIYARVDEMFAGGGSYATFTFGGLVAAEGFGAHTFSAGGTGGNLIDLRNTTAGTGNYAGVRIGNDADANAALIAALSSTYTTSAWNVQDGLLLGGTRAGGISIAATHASGVIRFYSGSGAERMRIDAAGSVYIGDTANAEVTLGLTINQGANDNEILALKSSDIAHALGTTETDTFGAFSKAETGLGGLKIEAFSEATSVGVFELHVQAASGSGDTTKSVAANGYLQMRAYENSTSIGANENILVLRNANATTHIFDAEGDSHQDVGTAWTNFDDHDDLALLHALSAGVSRADDPLRAAFGGFLEAYRATLERQRIVTFNDDGHHFINWSRAHMLTIGAVRQLGMQLQALQSRLRALEA